MDLHDRSNVIAVLAEAFPGERRVSLVPSDVARLSGKLAVLVEKGAGVASGYTDSDYVLAGASVVDHASAIEAAGTIAAVRPPQLGGIKAGTLIVSLGAYDSGYQSEMSSKSILHMGLERVPRTSKAQSMDVLSSQAAIAGYAAVIEGARALDILLPMMTTAAGGIKPARMISLGAGVAGLQAIATAKRLGAITFGFDVRKAAAEQVESLGARFVFPEIETNASETAGGYAAAQSDDQQLKLRRALTPILADMNLIVTSAQIPGRPAPLLIDEETFTALKPGTVVIDLAAETGGNTSHTRPNSEVTVSGVRVFGPTNLASLYATDSSRLFSGNMRALLDHLIDTERSLALKPDEEITAAMLAKHVSAAAAN